jgi:type IV pilus assembly protein PilM
LAQRVLGIDLGSYAVKVVEMEVGFRAAKLLRLHTFPVATGPEVLLERSLDALSAMAPPRPTDVVAVGVPGDRVLLRLLDIPFADPRKLGAVVGNELADDIPWELEDVLFDYTAHPDLLQGKVLAVAARSAEVKELLEGLGAHGIEPRSLAVGPLCYGGVLRQLAPLQTVMVVDIGHLTTNFCLAHQGRVLAARTISRGGHQITEILRQTYQLSYVDAEAKKEQEAVVATAEDTGLSADRRQLAGVVAEAVAPIVRELRLTMGLFGAGLGYRPEQVLLCGGTSLIDGLDRFVAAEIQIPARRLEPSGATEIGETSLTQEGEAMAALAMGIAMEQGGRRGIDLRQGEFAFKTDRSVFTEKLVFLAVSLVVVLVFAALSGYMSLYALRKEEKALKLQLTRVTKAVLGDPLTSPKKVSRLVKRGCRAKSFAIPSHTAFDVLDIVSREVPEPAKVKLDITRLDIKPGKTYVKGTADSRSAVGDIVKALEKHKCFSKVTSGKISDVSEGKKQFSLTITTECF